MVIIARFFIVLFKRNKKIELLRLDYDVNNLFNNSFIIVDYKFNNTIYYRFDGRKTLEKQIKIFNLENINNEIELVVYGFFRKKIYNLKFKPQLTINTENFKTSFSNLTLALFDQNIPKLTKSIKIINNNNNTSIIRHNINITTNNRLNITHKNFNQNEFI